MSAFATSMKVFNAIVRFLTKKPVLQQALLFNASAATKLQYELGRRRFHCFLSTSITSSIAHVLMMLAQVKDTAELLAPSLSLQISRLIIQVVLIFLYLCSNWNWYFNRIEKETCANIISICRGWSTNAVYSFSFLMFHSLLFVDASLNLL